MAEALRAGALPPQARPPADAARFRVTTAAEHDEIQAARTSGSHLAAAVAYARAGVRAGAEREVAALQAANPGDERVMRLRDSIARWP